MKLLSDFGNKKLSGKTCLLRVGFDIKNENLKLIGGRIPLRIKESLPTIKFLISRGAKIVILSHRGRPKLTNSKQSRTNNLKEFSLKPIEKILSKSIKKKVGFVDFNYGGGDLISKKDRDKIVFAEPGSIFLLENLRFMRGEEGDDKNFARQLASLGDFYVNDAFSVSHRENASVESITGFLPSYAGLLLEKEIKNLDAATKDYKKPLIVILGGAKISDKIGLIKNLYKKADNFLTGGGIANTLFVISGLSVGNSLYEKIKLDKIIVSGIGNKILLPIDLAEENKKILDIGPETVKMYSSIIKKAGTIIWNGPMGYIENKKFRKGSEMIIRAIMQGKAFSVIGGGETSSLITNYQLPITKKNIFISTGGGAMLEYLAGIKLPGIEALIRNKNK